MSDPNPLLLTVPGNNWLDPVVTAHLTSLSTDLGYSFYTGTWPSYVNVNGTFSSGYTQVVTIGGTFSPDVVTTPQQNLIRYFLSDSSGSVGGLPDVHFRDSF